MQDKQPLEKALKIIKEFPTVEAYITAKYYGGYYFGTYHDNAAYLEDEYNMYLEIIKNHKKNDKIK